MLDEFESVPVICSSGDKAIIQLTTGSGGPPGKGVTIAPITRGVWAVHRDLAEFGVSSVVLTAGPGATVVWDTLTRPDDWADWPSLGVAGEVVVVYSHADWDHCLGTAGLPGVTEVVAHRDCAERFAADLPVEAAAVYRGHPPPLVAPTRTFADSTVIPLGDAGEIELQWVGGHTADSIAGMVPSRGLLLAGDLAEDPIPEVRDPERLSAWIAALERWSADARVKRVVPGHGPVGGRGLLRRNARYLRSLEAGKPRPPRGLRAFYQLVHAENVAAVGGRHGTA